MSIESIDVRDCGLRGKSDEEVFSHAVRHREVILTADRGFGDISRFPLGSHSGIIILRFPNEITSSEFRDLLPRNMPVIDIDRIAGQVVIVERDKIRVRR